MMPMAEEHPWTKLDHALALLGKGFSIFPLKANTKDRPLVKEWQYAASNDQLQINQWWSQWPDANIGVCTTGMLVVDVDIKKGQLGYSSLMELEIDYDTFTVTTPSNGLHLYYTEADVPNSAGRLGPGLDVRGHHGYVVGPGSTLDGRPYATCLDRPVRPAPASLIFQAGRREDREPSSLAVDLDTLPSIDRVTHFLRDEAPLAVEGKAGNDTTYRVAQACRDMGVSAPQALVLMSTYWNLRCSPPWPMADLETVVKNAYRYSKAPEGNATPEAQFAGIKVELPPELARSGWLHDGHIKDIKEDWLFHNLLPAKGMALITGPTGSGKTFFSIELARCVAQGKEFFGTAPDDRGATLFVFSGTEGSGFFTRLKALEEDPLPIAARTLTKSLREGNELNRLLEDLELQCAEMLARYGVPVRLIIFETLSASGLLKDENDNAQAADALRDLAAMANKLGVLFVTSHHPPKSGAGSRGAGSIEGSIDFRIEISREPGRAVRDVDLRKARNAPERRLGSFSLENVTVGTDSRGRPIISQTLSQGEARGSLEKTAAHSPVFFQCIELALAQRRKIEPRAAWAERNDVVDEFKDHSRIPDRSNRAKAFKKVWDWALAMGQVEVRDEIFIRRKEPDFS